MCGEGGQICGAIQHTIGHITAAPIPTAAKALVMLALQRSYLGSPAYRSSRESSTASFMSEKSDEDIRWLVNAW